MIAHWPRRHPGLVLAALALATFGSLFPRGYMPVNDSGRITVSLCSASGPPRSITIDIGTKERPAQHSGSSNCWGLFTSFAALLPIPPLPLPFREWQIVAPTFTVAAQVVTLFHFDPNAPPQAPPLSSSR